MLRSSICEDLTRRLVTSVAIATIASALACHSSDVSGPGGSAPPVEGAEPYEPPLIYETWWEDVSNCSGRTRDFSGVRWFVMPDVASFKVGSGTYGGYWWPGRKILIAGAWVQHADLVRHEMLHDLLNSGQHPLEYFNEKCAGVVTPAAEPQQ